MLVVMIGISWRSLRFMVRIYRQIVLPNKRDRDGGSSNWGLMGFRAKALAGAGQAHRRQTYARRRRSFLLACSAGVQLSSEPGPSGKRRENAPPTDSRAGEYERTA